MKDSRFNKLRKAGWAALGVMVLTGAVILVVSLLRDNSVPQPQKITTVMRVVIPPPPPPPPPTPPPPPPPQPQKVVEQPKPAEQPAPKPTPKPAAKPTAKPASAVPRPPGNPLTAEAAPGANPYGLQAGDGSGDVIGGGGGGGGDGSGYYSNLVKSQVTAAIQQNDRTSTSRFKVIIRVWVNATGQVTRVSMVDASGNELTDDAITKTLVALSIGEGPPPNAPNPIDITIGAARQN